MRSLSEIRQATLTAKASLLEESKIRVNAIANTLSEYMMKEAMKGKNSLFIKRTTEPGNTTDCMYHYNDIPMFTMPLETEEADVKAAILSINTKSGEANAVIEHTISYIQITW